MFNFSDIQNPTNIVGLTIFTTVLSFFGVTPSVMALTMNGWDYSLDSFNDSHGTLMNGSGAGVGAGTYFEIYGSAVKHEAGETTFAIRSNLTLAGAASQYAEDGIIRWGDLIIDIACESLDAANGGLFGIRFDPRNGSNTLGVGVYSNVATFDLAHENGNLLDGLAADVAYVRGEGGDPRIGIFDPLNPYFNPNQHVPTLIQSGNLIGAVTMIEGEALNNLDLDYFDNLGGQTIAFKIDSSIIPFAENTCYYFGPECNNDLHAGRIPPVPTPAAVLPILSGLLVAAKRRNQTSDSE